MGKKIPLLKEGREIGSVIIPKGSDYTEAFDMITRIHEGEGIEEVDGIALRGKVGRIEEGVIKEFEILSAELVEFSIQEDYLNTIVFSFSPVREEMKEQKFLRDHFDHNGCKPKRISIATLEEKVTVRMLFDSLYLQRARTLLLGLGQEEFREMDGKVFFKQILSR